VTTTPAVSAARRLAAFTASLEPALVPDDVVETTKLHILDVIGCGLAAEALGLAGEGRATMAELGRGDATVIGLDMRLPAANAAFANAMLCHALDYDDTHSDSVCHISVVVIPAAIALAEENGLSGRELLTAVAAGTETVARIGMAATGAFHAHGFHPTATCGVFGATIAAARLARLDPETTAGALGIAGSMASGLLAFLNEGTQTKPINAAWAAHGGTIAARLAAHGGQGPPSVLEGRFGLYDSFLGAEAGIEAQLTDLGERWEALRIAYKPYPACHFMHGSLGATASLLDRVPVDEIDEICVIVPESVVPVICEPTADKQAPRSDYEGKFSLQYSTAAMLLHHRVNLDTFTAETRDDPAVLALARKVGYEVKRYETEGAAFPGGVRIRTVDGTVLEADCPYQLGAPQNPMTEAEVRAKFRANASLLLDTAAVDAIEEQICTLERQENLGAVLSLTAAREVAV
jgi:2-methylcitrate dehydratase PrpD